MNRQVQEALKAALVPLGALVLEGVTLSKYLSPEMRQAVREAHEKVLAVLTGMPDVPATPSRGVKCGCGDAECSGPSDAGHHQCGGPREACMMPGCRECGTPTPPPEAAATIELPAAHEALRILAPFDKGPGHANSVDALAQNAVDALAARDAELAKVREELERVKEERDTLRDEAVQEVESRFQYESRLAERCGVGCVGDVPSAFAALRAKLEEEKQAHDRHLQDALNQLNETQAKLEEAERERDTWRAEATRETQRGDVNWGDVNREKARADAAEKEREQWARNCDALAEQMKLEREDAEQRIAEAVNEAVAPLVQLFRDEEPQAGQRGDDLGISTAECAARLIREMRKTLRRSRAYVFGMKVGSEKNAEWFDTLDLTSDPKGGAK